MKTLTLLDFNYLIISNENFDDSSLKDTFAFFLPLGIRKFIFTVSYDPRLHPICWIMDRLRQLRMRLRTLRPRGTVCEVYPCVFLSEEIVYHNDIKRLCLKESSYLFLKIPPFSDPSNFDKNLNYLCFQRKCRPILVSFEDNLKIDLQHAFLERTVQSSLFHLSLDLNYVTALTSDHWIRFAIQSESRLLPGISHSLTNYPSVAKHMAELKEEIGPSNYTKFCRLLQESGHRLFSHS